MLNFTFSFREISYGENEDWDDVLLREVGHADLTATYWAQSKVRSSQLQVIKGHLDLGVVLIARLTSTSEVCSRSKFGAVLAARVSCSNGHASTTPCGGQLTFAELITWERLTSFALPFEGTLWLVLIGVIILSGCVDFLLERTRVPA